MFQPPHPPEANPPPPDSTIWFPEKFQPLFEPKRHKVFWGGRGGVKSWSFARALLLIGKTRGIRVLCVRELQNSIGESVHKLLSDQIKLMNLEKDYRIEKAKIYGPYGTEFSFEGIKNNVNKIKSYEAIDICWVEEANKVSRNSWEVLIPTIRKEGSEIWISFNPELETDYTYQRFVLRPSEGSIVVKTTWRDNPWFTKEMYNEMMDLKKRDPDAYLNVWEGECRQMLQGAVFAKELRRTELEGRITRVHWDGETPVDTYWDLGRRDSTCIWFGQRVGMQYRLLGYFEDQQEDIHYYLRHLQSREWIYGTHYLPHDAKAQRLGQRRTIEQIVRSLGHKVYVVPRVHKKVNAINAARIVFPSCYFDKAECSDGLDRLRHYCYEVIETDQTINGVRTFRLSEEPIHDENSHGADAFMTFAQSIKTFSGKLITVEERKKSHFDEYPEARGLGWMG